MKTKTIVTVSLLVALAIAGGYLFPRSTEKTILQSFSGVGDTNATARVAQCSLDFSTTTPSTVNGASCLSNGDSKDRIISSIEVYGTGLTNTTSNGTGIKVWYWTVATSTGVYTADGNKVWSSSVSTSTAPTLFVVSSTTPGTTGVSTVNDYARVWASGTNLNVFVNGTSTATGWIRVSYSPAP